MGLHTYLTRHPSDVDLVVVTDGRTPYLQRCIESLQRVGFGSFNKVIVVDDSASPQHGAKVDEWFAGSDIVHHPEKRGMAQAVRSGWDRIEADYAFHLEEDFVLLRELPAMKEVLPVLEAHKHLANMGFKRKPWWGREVELDDQLAAICEQSTRVQSHESWTQHDHIYSLNPHLVPRRIFKWGWPDGNEAGQTVRLLDETEPYTFGMWGHVGDAPYFEHIGVQRSLGWAL